MKLNNNLTIFSIFITVIYVICIYVLVEGRLEKLLTIDLNEIGDFFAGIFGPLAIFWLIVGYLQQGKELRQSSEALRLQAEELKNSVQQQKELVEISKVQFQAELDTIKNKEKKEALSLLPVLIFEQNGYEFDDGSYKISYQLKNSGALVTDLNIKSNYDMEISQPYIPVMENNDKKRIIIKFRGNVNLSELQISCRNKIDQSLAIDYQVMVDEGNNKYEIQKLERRGTT